MRRRRHGRQSPTLPSMLARPTSCTACRGTRACPSASRVGLKGCRGRAPAEVFMRSVRPVSSTPPARGAPRLAAAACAQPSQRCTHRNTHMRFPFLLAGWESTVVTMAPIARLEFGGSSSAGEAQRRRSLLTRLCLRPHASCAQPYAHLMAARAAASLASASAAQSWQGTCLHHVGRGALCTCTHPAA